MDFVRAGIVEEHQISIRKCLLIVLSEPTIWLILLTNFIVKAYMILITRELKYWIQNNVHFLIGLL